MLESLKKIHLKMEKFFSSLAGSASLPVVLLVFLFASLFAGLLWAGTEFRGGLLVGFEKNFSEVFWSGLQKSVLVGVLVLIISFTTALSGKLFKGRGVFSKLLFLQSLLFLFGIIVFAALLLLLEVWLTEFSDNIAVGAVYFVLSVSIALFSLYLQLAVIKTINKIEFAPAGATFIIANIATSILFLIAFVIISALTPHSPYYAHALIMKNDSSGLEILYNTSHGECVFKVPPDWRPVGDDRALSILKDKEHLLFWNKTYAGLIVFERQQQDDKQEPKEYFYFMDGVPPIRVNGITPLSCSRYKTGIGQLRKVYSDDFIVKSVEYIQINETNSTACDIRSNSLDDSITVHEVGHDFEGSTASGKIGYTLVYKTLTQKEQGVKEMLLQIECH